MYQQDFIMRQIEDMGRMLSMLLLGRAPKAGYIEEAELYEADEALRSRLNDLLRQGKIDEAENILFEVLEANPSKANFAAALSFYSTLSQWEDEKLEACGFSYSEILEGLNDVKRLYIDGEIPL